MGKLPWAATLGAATAAWCACAGGVVPSAEPGGTEVSESGFEETWVEPIATLPVYDPDHPRSPEAQAEQVQKIRDGVPFNALSLLPTVRVASQKASDEAVVEAGTGVIRVPLAGNEALLDLATGEVLAGNRASNATDRGSAGTNIFGFARKVVSVEVVHDQIVIRTAPARMTDLFAGAVMLPPFPLVTAQPIDASGVNLGDWFADWGEGYGPPAAGKQGELEQQYGAWGVDFTYTGNWGVKDKRALTVAVEQQVKGITLSATGELDLDVNVGFVPEIKFGFDVHTPIDVWNSYLNYMRFSAGGTFYADAIVDAVLTIAAKASVSAAQLAEAKSTVKKSMPMPKSKSPKFKLGMIGPFAGPSLGPVPTTFLVEFVAACEVTTYATIKANMEGHVKAGATFGFDYERGKGLSFPLNTTFEKSASFTFLSGEGGVLAECTFGPRLQWKIADIGGPYVDGHAGAQADLIYKSECPPSSKVPKSGAPPATIAAEARVGIVVGFGGEIEIGKWGITLWEYDFGSMTLVNEWWKLWGKVWDVGYGLGSCASDCEDKIRNNAEGDVDCGGICPKKCPAGSSCFAVSDCPAGLNCNLGKCSTLNSSDPCNDGVRGTGELDVDCGGKCPKCKLGQMCFKNDDCLSGMCPPIGGGGASQCAAWDCNNGVQEKGAETDVDCGAECTKAWPYRGCGSGKHCLVDKDCDAGICMWMGYRDGKDKPVDPLPVELSAPQRYCVPPDCDHMANGVKDDGTGFVVKETGIDCGGGCVDIINPPNSGTCLTKNLEDLTEIERISGYQTKLACGKDYLRCRYLGGCKTGADCMSGYCGPTGLCGVPPCVNGFADFAEGDVDCGGPCKAKCDALSRCKADSDCKPDWAGNPMTCSNWDWDVPNAFGGQKVCRPFDANGVFDPLLESDVDCGWQSAKKCKVGQNCGRPEYCEAGLACVAKPFFDGGVCTAVGTCSDGKKTDYETDVDCGGTRWCPDCAGYCPRCADGKGCWLNEHCKSGKCVGAQSPGPGPGTPFKMGTCASSCENGVIDAADGEGDVDCGGPKCANKCRAGWKCKSNDQCKTGFCLSGKCSISTCDDGLQLGTETDVDCGGGCAKCAKGRKCGVNADCISWVCNASKVCAAGTCDNGKLDVGETDVDCGGPCGPTCKPAAACTGTGDCASGQCTGGKCACATGSYRDAATGACLLCACRLAGSTGSACDATGQCSCKPDWTGAKCDAFIGSCGPGACPVTPCRNPGLDTPWRFDSGPGSSDAAAADFDGDALPDLVVTNGPENAIRVFPGRAGGGFKAPRTFPTGPYPIALVVADLDADGRLDVATADYHGSSSTTPAAVSVLLGNGDGTFKPKADYPVVIQANTIAVADVNGDKVLDLVAGNDPSWGVVSGGVSLLLGNGNGTFKARVDVAGLSSPIALGDANGDGRADLASRAYGNFGVSIANANGTFQGAKAVPLTPNAFALADMNGDKRADLVATVSGTPGSVRVLLAGTSATTPFQGDGASYPATAYDGVTLSDLDGDGVQDVLLRGQNGLQVLTGKAGGTLGAARTFVTGTRYRSPAIADFDRDGRADLALLRGYSSLFNEVGVALGRADGTFRLEYAGDRPVALATGDLDGDGKADLVIVNAGAGTVDVHRGEGGGRFKDPVSYPVAASPGAIVLADFDGDKKTDVAVAYSNPNTGSWDYPKGKFGVAILPGNGDGTFQARRDVAPDNGFSSLAAGDLDGDGDLDLVGTADYRDFASVLLNDGTGKFPARTDLRTDPKPVSVVVRDFDGNGRPDLAVSCRNAGTLGVYLNRGDGTFPDSIDYAAGAEPGAVASGDFDGDGRPDLAVWGGAKKVSVLLGKGGGAFKTRTEWATGSPGNLLSVADLTGDQRPDLVASDGDNGVILLAGAGDGSFRAGLRFRSGRLPAAAAVADLDADGLSDLTVLNRSQEYYGGSTYTPMRGTCLDAVICSNGKADPGEADVDCGGSCPKNPCAVGRKCVVNGDCASLTCLASGVCGQNSCFDGAKGGAETDVDCGGGCAAKCATGKGCKVGTDCASTFCDGAACVATACEDRLLSAAETDVDCGSACPSKCAAGKRCKAGADCASGFCDGTYCVTTACKDKKKSPAETDVDCGGACTAKCAVKQGCKTGTDCASGFCDGAVCVASSCSDKVKSGSETDVDCGGSCAARCSTGKACGKAADCASGICSASNKCVTSTCDDGRVDGDETDLDCGGSCATDCLIGAKCKSGADCISGVCTAVSLVCATSTCFNQKLDFDETDVDCGGSCKIGCANGSRCNADVDCSSKACGSVSRKCVASACLDERKDGDESDVDCGGSCAADCATGQGCRADADCVSTACNVVTYKCAATKCLDQKVDGGESDVDCGGPCPAKCALGAFCTAGADCTSGVCSTAGKCVATTCEDGRLSGDETDVDCGGSCAADCATGKGCLFDNDCISASCAAISAVCVTGPCFDQRKDGAESDVDCGGSCAAKCGLGAGCAAASDCTSGICSAGGKCVGSTCQDGRVSGDETDVDCGGSCAADCATGHACRLDGDCASGSCASVSHLCVASACQDERKDGTESDVDCGGTCATKCALGATCLSGFDCGSGVCSNTGRCVATTCEDGRLSGDETDVDCGGSCAADCATGKGCLFDNDCISASCAAISAVCVTGPCFDQRKDGDETDVDCGGSCAADCGLGLGCAVAADCTSGICSAAGACVADFCQDGRKNGTETDVDCGGSCPLDCAAGRACGGDGDCQSALCASVSRVCVASACQDERKDGTETDVDCGGSCPLDCANGLACTGGGDCVSGICSTGGLCVGTYCEDGRKSGTETDVDCGGSCVADCADGRACGSEQDCQSGMCASVSKVCVASTCLDEFKDGDETDVDCGGSCAADCANGLSCATGADCVSAVCSVGSKCVASTCLDGRKDGSETDVDCGGTCALDCSNGQGCAGDGDCLSTLCATTSKVCVGSTCVDERKDGTETDVDCGGSCPLKCANGLACTSGASCLSGVCSVGLKCVASTCLDGRLSGDESDVDCGGSCTADCANGKNCKADGDCLSAQCTSGTKLCVASACQNQRKDANETDVDCGGACGATCADGTACLLDGDCASGVCSIGNLCVATTCENGRQDGDEGGVDCGGSCPNSCDPCTGVVCEPTACRLAGTCVDGTCTDGAAKADGSSCGGGKTCQAGFCSTMIDNGDGTVVDPVSKLVWNKAVYVRSWDSGLDSICAGLGLPGTGWRTPDIDEMRSLIRDCSVTVTGGACNIAVGGCTAEACRHVLCNGCEPMAGPDEGCWWDPVLQGTCGAPYAWFSRTVRDATTAWGVHGINASVLAVSRQPGQSSLLRCVTSHCKSGVKDSNETDVDCGGNCAGCADGKACLVNGDCASGGCSGNVCQACPAGKVKSDGACVDTSTSGLNVSGIEQIEKGPVSLYIAPPGSLVSNGGAETGDLTDWSHEGYEAWGIVPNTAVPEPVRGKPLFGAKGFVGPHGTSQLVQTIDLISAGYTAEQLDAGIQVRVGFFGRGYGRTGTDKVGLTYRFLDEFDGEVEPPFWSSYLGAEADVWGTSTAAGTWAMPAKNTTSIPPTTRKIMMVMWSMDGEGWAGQWGPVVDGAHVVLGAREMRMRNAGGAWGAWQAYAPVVTGWALPAGDGAKTVEVEFRDGAGVSLGTATDSVTVKQCMIRGACNDSGCAFDPKPDLTACDDGIPNNEADVCKNGDCVGCHDGNECTDDSWVPGTGCVHVTVPDWTTTCDNETGVCVGGACIPW